MIHIEIQATQLVVAETLYRDSKPLTLDLRDILVKTVPGADTTDVYVSFAQPYMASELNAVFVQVTLCDLPDSVDLEKVKAACKKGLIEHFQQFEGFVGESVGVQFIVNMR